MFSLHSPAGAPGQGILGPAQTFNRAPVHAERQHGTQPRQDQYFPNQASQQPTFDYQAPRAQADIWAHRGARAQPFDTTNSEHITLSNLPPSQSNPATQQWQAILAQAPHNFAASGSSEQTRLLIQRFVTSRTNQWFDWIFQKT